MSLTSFLEKITISSLDLIFKSFFLSKILFGENDINSLVVWPSTILLITAKFKYASLEN